MVNYAMDFDDVAEGQWYTEAVRWAASEGIVAGTGKGFSPDAALTRESLAAILFRYAGGQADGDQPGQLCRRSRRQRLGQGGHELGGGTGPDHR